VAVKPSILDRIVRELAPASAVNRLYNKHRFQVMSSPTPMNLGQAGFGSYAAAEDSRQRSHQAFSRSLKQTEDEALNAFDRDRVRLELRDLERNNPLTGAIVDRIPSYAIFRGIWPQAQTKDKNWNKIAEDWWRQVYSPAIDFRQRPGADIVMHQKLIIRHWMIDGDLGYILLKNGQIQPIEPERITDPQPIPGIKKGERIVQGVKISRAGITLGYYISDRDKMGNINDRKFQFVKRENFIHCLMYKRIDQVRGVPKLANIANKLRDYDKTDDNIFAKIKAESNRLFKRFTKEGDASNDAPRGGRLETDSDNKDPKKIIVDEWGQVMDIPLGEDMVAFEGVTPHREYVTYMVHQIKLISAALGIPFEFVMLMFTQGSFSAQRAAMLHAQHAFVEVHDFVVKSFLQRLWNWRIAKAMNDGVLPFAPVDEVTGMSQWFKVEWTVPFMGWVDPDKQAKADAAEIKGGQKSLKSAISARGKDRDEVFNEKADDIRAAKLKAKEINEDKELAGDQDPVTWRDIADIGTAPKGPTP